MSTLFKQVLIGQSRLLTCNLLLLISFLRTFTEQWNLTLFEMEWENKGLLKGNKIDPKEEHPILSTDYRDGIALFAVKQTSLEGYCVKGG